MRHLFVYHGAMELVNIGFPKTSLIVGLTLDRAVAAFFGGKGEVQKIWTFSQEERGESEKRAFF